MKNIPMQAKLSLAAPVRRRGFTLIELLVVLVILGLLASLVGPRVINYLGGAKSDAARLQALVQQPPGVTGGNGPYLKKMTLPKDPWGNDYRYASPSPHGPYEIRSLGADGKEGGDGDNKDINSWEDAKK